MMALSTNAVGNSIAMKTAPSGFFDCAVSALFLVVLIRRLHRAGHVARRGQHGDVTRFHPLLEVVAADAVVLHRQHARYGPFAVLGEADLADKGVELVAMHVIGELRLV